MYKYIMGKTLKDLLKYGAVAGFFLLLCYNSYKPLGNSKSREERQQFNRKNQSYAPSNEIPLEYTQPKRLPIEFLYPQMYFHDAREKTSYVNL